MNRAFQIIRLGTLPELPPVEWLLRGWIPRANLVLVEGEEGVGKGYFLCWCLVQAASGAWGLPVPGLYLSSEEEPEVIQARLLAAGWKPGVHADIHVLRVNEGDDLVRLPLDHDAVVAVIREFKVGMVATDLLRDHCAPTEDMGIRQRSNNDETWIRPAAGSWQRAATKTGAVILGAHHRNKTEVGSARAKSTGSGAWRQRARVVIVLAEVNGERAIAVDKNNLAAEDKVPTTFDLLSVTEDVAAFAMGDRTDSRDISTWEKERRETKFVIDPVGTLVAWLVQNLKKDSKLPPRDQLMAMTSLSQGKLRGAIATLRDGGVLLEVTGKGQTQGLYWTGRTTWNGSH